MCCIQVVSMTYKLCGHLEHVRNTSTEPIVHPSSFIIYVGPQWFIVGSWRWHTSFECILNMHRLFALLLYTWHCVSLHLYLQTLLCCSLIFLTGQKCCWIPLHVWDSKSFPDCCRSRFYWMTLVSFSIIRLLPLCYTTILLS